MKCKLIVNRDSGHCDKLDVGEILQSLGCEADEQIIDCKTEWSAEGYDTVIVCGGDGTLHNAIEKCRGKNLVYVPCGTLNETAQTERQITSLGCVNGQLFSYVCATGSFTEIGYRARNANKKRWKGLAYLPQVLKAYRCHEIAAKLTVDGKIFEGKYTLLMVLKSFRCFGFPFNSDYKRTKKTYLLAVRSFGRDNLANRAKMFFPFFRIFFCGVRPKITANWTLLPFENLTICLDEPHDFCFDGEKRRLEGNLHFSQQTLDRPIPVLFATGAKGKKQSFCPLCAEKILH